jgi:hypothetical protein
MLTLIKPAGFPVTYNIGNPVSENVLSLSVISEKIHSRQLSE